MCCVRHGKHSEIAGSDPSIYRWGNRGTARATAGLQSCSEGQDQTHESLHCLPGPRVSIPWPADKALWPAGSLCHSRPQSPAGLGGGAAESLQLSLPAYRDFHKVETFHGPPQITIASGAPSTSKEEVRVWLRWMKGTQRNVDALRGQRVGGRG